MRDTDLVSEHFEPLRWSVHELLPEGGILFGGPEKGGKSWLLLGSYALSIASGRNVFGRFPVERGSVLYLGMEDSPRRLQSRVVQLMAGMGISEPTGRLHAYGKGEWPTGEEGGYQRIEEWLDDYPDARAVIVDPVAEFDPIPATYLKGREAMMRWVRIGERHHVSAIISQHTGKFASSTKRGVNGNGRSWRDAILGRAASAADCIQGLFADMSAEPVETAVLKTTGKDVRTGDIGLRFSAETGLWSAEASATGPQTAEAISSERRLVLAILGARGPSTAQEIADARYGGRYDSAYHLLADMRAAGQVKRINGIYMTPEQARALDTPAPNVVQGELGAPLVHDALLWTGEKL